MIYGYARVSTKGQAKDGNSLEAQELALRSAGASVIYMDAFTGTKANRPELDKLMTVMQSGDTMVVTKLDRIARSAIAGIEMIQGLLDKCIVVHVLNHQCRSRSRTYQGRQFARSFRKQVSEEHEAL